MPIQVPPGWDRLLSLALFWGLILDGGKYYPHPPVPQWVLSLCGNLDSLSNIPLCGDLIRSLQILNWYPASEIMVFRAKLSHPSLGGSPLLCDSAMYWDVQSAASADSCIAREPRTRASGVACHAFEAFISSFTEYCTALYGHDGHDHGWPVASPMSRWVTVTEGAVAKEGS
ncbi:hypothetical protein DFH09DRAFT_1109444 [Mycena vulgaris]|nr:hypothetical protein DFH09DRAFT_1109444 [Mycena vulgaris]